MCSTTGQGHWPGSLQERPSAVACSWVGPKIVLWGQAEMLSGLPCQAGIQAILCSWEESLKGLCAWARSWLYSAIGLGSDAELDCRLGS